MLSKKLSTEPVNKSSSKASVASHPDRVSRLFFKTVTSSTALLKGNKKHILKGWPYFLKNYAGVPPPSNHSTYLLYKFYQELLLRDVNNSHS